MRHPSGRGRLSSVLLAAAMAGLAACDSWFGPTEDDPLPGERIPVLLGTDAPEPDARVADLDVRLPQPIVNAVWPQQGGTAAHSLIHLALADAPSERWRVDAGGGVSDDRWLLSGPVVADGRIYVMDTDATVTAFDAATGARVWRMGLEGDDERDASWGGGVAYADGRIYAATGFAQVIALDALSGAEIWRRSVSGAMRAAPTADGGLVFVVTRDNQMHALDGADGQILWSHTGIAETSGLMGGGSPAVEGDIVVVPYSSGEIFALRGQNGRPLWSDSLTAIRRVDAVSALADIRGRPVIADGRVYAISHSGRMVAIDQRTGRRIWEADLGGVEQPWIAGDFAYVVTSGAVVVCLTTREGLIRWVTPLQLYDDPDDRQGRINWSGPILAGDRLIIAGSNREVLSLSPYTGQILGRMEMPDGVPVAPIVAGSTLYILTDDADLIALR